MNRRDVIKIIVFVAALVFAVLLVGRIEGTQSREETEIVKKAVRNAAVTCYAVEGAYPEDIEYLKRYYRLSYDEERYYVTYEVPMGNRLPDIWVTEKGAELK